MPRWPTRGAPSPREAAALQAAWSARVIRRRTFENPRVVAGVDVGVKDDVVRAAVCLLSFPGLEPLEQALHAEPVTFPYVPGLLGFREVPCIVRAFERLATTPDVCLVDGHGLSHPRRFGVATHLGVELDLPTIGVAKTRLVGEHREPGPRRGASTRLVHRPKGGEPELVGRVVRTRAGVAPVFVSIGHRVDLESAVRLTLRCTPRFRLPEPIRAAHRLAAEAARG